MARACIYVMGIINFETVIVMIAGVRIKVLNKVAKTKIWRNLFNMA